MLPDQGKGRHWRGNYGLGLDACLKFLSDGSVMNGRGVIGGLRTYEYIDSYRRKGETMWNGKMLPCCTYYTHDSLSSPLLLGMARRF